VSTFGNKVYGIITGSPQGVPADACVGSTVPDCAAQVAAAKAQLGDLISANQNGRHLRTLAEVGKFNYQYIVDNKATLDPVNPDFKPGDANPYGLAAVKGGALVVDAGANTLGFASRNGNVKVLRTADHKPAYFPNPPGPAHVRGTVRPQHLRRHPQR